jgi:diguanylate cyclase (GGDEF)-like protein
MCSHIHLTPELDPKGNVVSILAVGRDITEIDAYRKQIHNLAFFDPLTNLPNRSLLSDCIRQTVDDTSCHGHQFGLMMIDLDRFKEINDTLGHSIGNQILREAAQRLQGCVRICDTVARLGGDEFAILLPKIYSGLDLETIACKILVAFNHPFIVDGRELFVSGSIGIALYPDDSADIETLFSYADSAMYHAKQQGRNNYQFFSANLTEKAVWRMSIENDLRKAQERNELELHYQPQVELESGKIIGAEALLRWNHSKKGLIAPDKFISVAEETGLIVGIGEWVLLSACQAAVAWNANREIPLCIAVNLSTRQFIRNDLVGTVQRILQETACNPSWIKLEITESLLLEDSTEIATMLDTFNSMGHAISIDDFGTGYSALSYLNRFPVSQIKIDRSFVKDIPNDHDKTELVKVMISISQVLKMELVAEGVETREQADCLLANGCGIVQGYLFGKPMPYAAFEKLMANSVC